MNIPVLIFLFGVWFNPNQIVTLSDRSGDCQINLSTGRFQSGPVYIVAENISCDVAAEAIVSEIGKQITKHAVTENRNAN